MDIQFHLYILHFSLHCLLKVCVVSESFFYDGEPPLALLKRGSWVLIANWLLSALMLQMFEVCSVIKWQGQALMNSWEVSVSHFECSVISAP